MEPSCTWTNSLVQAHKVRGERRGRKATTALMELMELVELTELMKLMDVTKLMEAMEDASHNAEPEERDLDDEAEGDAGEEDTEAEHWELAAQVEAEKQKRVDHLQKVKPTPDGGTPAVLIGGTSGKITQTMIEHIRGIRMDVRIYIMALCRHNCGEVIDEIGVMEFALNQWGRRNVQLMKSLVAVGEQVVMTHRKIVRPRSSHYSTRPSYDVIDVCGNFTHFTFFTSNLDCCSTYFV